MSSVAKAIVLIGALAVILFIIRGLLMGWA